MADLSLPFRWQRAAIAFAALSAGLGVAIAALNAHLPERFLVQNGREMAQRAIDMQMWHSLALLILGLWGAPFVRGIAAGFAAGIVLFCVPVYCLAFRGPDIAFLAPWGGTTIIVSWLALAFVALRYARRR
ncbi:hypothetical protein AA101099_2670 [Neoasaia chiangmaiensis NBRC 101099]|uniref:Uncharacterized protein n=1 Tax=Neoasaia chiangmaiensis TaxID=320497 RepID=A0A1U9KPD1_9PROT|nr:DUF423 domain-containing protein [Neoasaia chiangmaiensis]AQS87668.1 hypothetical protein A0U93_06695 [Neoasaia chiangmaiensis]GBR41906.1 hypothetical protein AA101099_2670 [Neoasaia chiangmaiensis NBRC 101099]GEN14252.1 membrane protein [Neoasaia chiangmaiensis]